MTKRKNAVSYENAQVWQTHGITLREKFPEYRTAQEVRREIAAVPQLEEEFLRLKPQYQEDFLNICCGNQGVKILYDSFFKYVFHPDAGKWALARLISVMLGQDVKDFRILPNESNLAADYTLVIMDIVVEIADGSIINVEVQKIGYNFPGQRAACYNADLLLRQYERVRQDIALRKTEGDNSTDREFNYSMIRPVFTIVFMEKSTSAFKDFMDIYIHTFTQTSDTGLDLDLLQNYIFIPLDIFRQKLKGKLDTCVALTEKEAWLAFLSSDEPQVIGLILEQYPEIFRPLYERICDLCRNTAEVMNMFSKELAILDKNTVIMMIEEQRDTIEKLQKELDDKQGTIDQQQGTIDQQQGTIDQQQGTIDQQQALIEDLQKSLEALRKEIRNS